MTNSKTGKVIHHLRRAVLQRDGAGMTDGQLLDCFLTQRDDAAFAALVRRHGPLVWGVCRRILHHHHDAEDAFQATFLVLARKGASIEPKEMVGNWLYGVAHQTALKARAVAGRRKERERQVVEMPEPAVEEPGVGHDLQPLLDQELSRLPDKYRAPIILCDLEGKTRREAAHQLGWPEGTVAGRLALARKMLARRLVQRGVVLSGGTLAVVLSHHAAAGVPPTVLNSTIQAATVLAAGQAATGLISVKVAVLMEGVLKSMLMTKLKMALAVLLVVAVLSGAAGLIYQTQAAEPLKAPPVTGNKAEAKAEAGDAPKKGAENGKGKKTKKEAKEGSLLGELEKVDPKEGIITVTRQGRLVGGLGGKRGGIGFFKNNIRLENLPVAQTARILVNGKKATLGELKPGMALSLQLAVKGGITVQEITAESK